MQAGLRRALLTGVAQMRSRITMLEGQRRAAVSAEATALRRLERDIHDGPQQRLVRLAIDLGRAQQQFDADPEAARRTIEEALAQTRETLDELRALSRGIAPPILVDRGLPSALAALAGRGVIPVDLFIEPVLGTPEGRLDPAVESAAYFVVAESLTNVAKHSQATVCRIVGQPRGPGAAGRDRRRRRGRRAHLQGTRPGRARRPGARGGRSARRGQPRRRPDPESWPSCRADPRSVKCPLWSEIGPRSAAVRRRGRGSRLGGCAS